MIARNGIMKKSFLKAVMPVPLKKYWLSPPLPHQNHYAWHTLGAALGIALLCVVLVCAGTAAAFRSDLPQVPLLLALTFGITALGVLLAARQGRRSMRESSAFFLTEDDHLYALDARMLFSGGHSLLRFGENALRTQSFLRKLAAQPFLPSGSREITLVLHIRENRSHYSVRCRTQPPGAPACLRTIILPKGLPNEDDLIYELQRRQRGEEDLPIGAARRPLYILLGLLVLAGFSFLCILSHPAVGRLAQSIYFPCLGGAFLSLFFTVYAIVRQRRGE